MDKQIVILYLTPWLMCIMCNTFNDTTPLGNSSDSNKDMYVIHAMVYQVGILTNKTDNETAHLNATGNQEALTFYRTNGSQVDLSQIPAPLITNVTAQSLIGVAPVSGNQSNGTLHQLSWNALQNLNLASSSDPVQEYKQNPVSIKSIREVHSNPDFGDSAEKSFDEFYKRVFKRDVTDGMPVEIQKGVAVIPSTAGVQSIAIPPLLTLNNNLSQIPVAIPNTSIVHYAKINTLVSTP